MCDNRPVRLISDLRDLIILPGTLAALAASQSSILPERQPACASVTLVQQLQDSRLKSLNAITMRRRHH